VLADAVLFGNVMVTALAAPDATTKHGSQPNLCVDLLHALKVGLGGTLGSEDDVLGDQLISSNA
jgi:hypothetical protein